MFEKVEKWYKQGLWSAKMVWDAAMKGTITDEQAAEIVNPPSPAPDV